MTKSEHWDAAIDKSNGNKGILTGLVILYTTTTKNQDQLWLVMLKGVW